MRRYLPEMSVAAGWLCVMAVGLVVGVVPARGEQEIALQQFAIGARRPTWAVAAPGDTTRFYVLEQSTTYIRVLDMVTRQYKSTPFLSVTTPSLGHEAGLLCMVFHPEYPESAYVYIYYNRGPQYTQVIERHTVSPNPDLTVPGSAKDILTFTSPAGIHNGGWMSFGPDGYLYFSSGDGGAPPGDDPGDSGPGHDPLVGNAQSDTTRHGKILRIDVNGGDPYGIPTSNPFYGEPSPKNEFWAKGLRNPWRCAFDRATGDLYIADVGKSSWEEIDFQPASSPGGENYGWRLFLGYAIYNCPIPCDSSGLTRPFYAYPRPEKQCACVIGGMVYRGAAMPELQGSYFFGDYCTKQVWTLRNDGGVATDVQDRSPEIWRGPGANILRISSFAEDANGEMYILSQDPNGTIYKIIPYTPTLDVTAKREPPFLGPAVPNPSAGTFSFRVQAPTSGIVKLGIYAVDGRRVRTLIDARRGPVARDVVWDARDDGGAPVRAGLYFLRLEAAGTTAMRKVAVSP